MKFIKLFEDVEVTQCNTTGTIGSVSPNSGPFLKSGGVSGEPGIVFTPQSQKLSNSYKNRLYQKKYFKKNKKREMEKKFTEAVDGMGNVTSAQPSPIPGQVHIAPFPTGLSGGTMEHLVRFEDYVMEDATVSMGSSNGMGPVSSAQPSATPGDGQGGTPGSGDIGHNFGTSTKNAPNFKKRKRKFIKKRED